LFNNSGGSNLTLFEIKQAAEINNLLSGTNIIFGANINEEMGDEVMVTVICHRI
jgi:cell division protein FtsZ